MLTSLNRVLFMVSLCNKKFTNFVFVHVVPRPGIRPSGAKKMFKSLQISIERDQLI
jgi:hypothetical protein